MTRKIREPRLIDSNGTPPGKCEMTFWVCRRCHVVKMYTLDELRLKTRHGTPICGEGVGHEINGDYIQSYFMQQITIV